MRQKLLLIEDVEDLGKSGEIVSVKPGYARNFLLPKQKACIAKTHTLRMQKRLQEERAKRAIVEAKEAGELSKVLENVVLSIDVKVDPEGRMYGSVSANDIINLLEKENIKLDKKSIVLKHPIKKTGVFDISFKLKEGVMATCKLKIMPEGVKELELPEKKETKKEEVLEEKVSEEEAKEKNLKKKEEKESKEKSEK